MMSDRKAQLKKHLIESRQKLLAVLDGVEGDQWNLQVQSDGEQWTVIQMLRHLQSAHQGLSGQMKRIVIGEPTVPPDFDLDRWNGSVQRKTTEMSPEIAFENLNASHEKLLEFVDNLSEADFEKEGFHPSFKQVFPLHQFLIIVGEHEVQHGKEIAQALGKSPTTNP